MTRRHRCLRLGTFLLLLHSIVWLLTILLPCFRRSDMTVARFDPTGKHIFVGTSLGYILVFNTRTKSVRLILYSQRSTRIHFVHFPHPPQLQMVARHKVSGAGIMRGFDFAKSGRYEKLLRPLSLPILTPDSPMLDVSSPTLLTEHCGSSTSPHIHRQTRLENTSRSNLSQHTASTTRSVRLHGIRCLLVRTGNGLLEVCWPIILRL